MNYLAGYLPNFLTNATTGNIFNNSNITKKEAIKDLKGLEKQLVELSKKYNHPVMKSFYDTEADKFKTRIALLIGSEKKDKIDFSAKLKALIDTCDIHLTGLKENNENQQTTSEEKWENLTFYRDTFNNNHENNLQLLKDAAIKMISWQNKILKEESSLLQDNEAGTNLVNAMACKVKSVQNGFIANEVANHHKRAVDRKAEYKTLKFDWLDSRIQYLNVEDRIQHSIFKLETLPEVALHAEDCKIPKLYFNSLKKSLDHFSTHSLSKDFVEKYKPGKEEELTYKRNLTPFFEGIRNYKVRLKKLSEAGKVIDNLNITRNTLLPKIESQMTNISTEIEIIDDRGYSALSFLDETSRQQLHNQKAESIQSLNLLRNEIEQKWNAFCMDLYTLHHQKIIFEYFQAVSEKMAWCFIMAEHIQGNLRKLRLTENSRASQEIVYTNLKDDYLKLCKLITETNEALRNEQIKLLDVSALQMPVDQKIFFDISQMSCIENSSNELSNTSGLCLKTEYEKAMNAPETFSTIYPDISLEKTSVEDMAKAIGLVWNDKTKEEVLKSFSNQKDMFAEEIKSHKANILNAYETILPPVVKLATFELNRIGKALHEFPAGSGYDDQFTDAYYCESPVLETAQRFGEAIVNVVTNNPIVNVVTYKPIVNKPIQPTGQFVKFVSPM